MGSVSTVGAAILEEERVDAVSFTGSVETGGTVAQTCAARGAKS